MHDGLNSPDDLIVVTGAGGFIGGWLARRLAEQGHRAIRSVDIKPLDQWFQRVPGADERVADLRRPQACRSACVGAAAVYNLACDMGGIGYIETHKAACMISVLINTNMLVAAREAGVGRYFYTSSACVYPGAAQRSSHAPGLREADAYPADPEDGYGWEKLFSERMCRHFTEDYGLQTRVARLHNVYGPQGTWRGGREKAPAAICRKVAQAKLTGDHRIEIWGDGEQTRSFLYIEDCLAGARAIMDGDHATPFNLGSEQLVTINHLVDMVEAIAGVELERSYRPGAATGVRGRNSDNSLIRDRLGWQPSIPLERGLELTYAWIYDQLASAG